ncbi:MAG: glycosyl hydrolase 2 galactose-binding domain-containing protein, partial [Candidatus Sumerlaeota bacterium]
MYHTINLNGKWDLVDSDLYFDAEQVCDIRALPKDKWIQTPVPGDIHQGLVGAGRIPEPLLGLNSYDSEWTATRSWWFRNTFNVEAPILERDIVELELNGLDSNARVYLNGRLVGEHINAFRPFVKDVKKYLDEGQNELLVRLTAGVENVTEAEMRGPDSSPANTEAGNGRPDRGDSRRNFVRRPQYAFGWDWSPKCPTTAIGGDILLRAMDKATIRDVYLKPERSSKKEVVVHALVTVETFHPWSTCDGTVSIALADAEGKTVSAKWTGLLRSGLNFIECELRVENPRLWWPVGMGEAHLYRADAKLEIDDKSCEYPAFDWGLRYIELDTRDTFALRVNGKKVFAKGANWIPADTIYARVRDRDYEILIEEAVGANFNMLRIWGGGLYERDIFFQ